MLTDKQRLDRLELIREICKGMGAEESTEFEVNEYCFGDLGGGG